MAGLASYQGSCHCGAVAFRLLRGAAALAEYRCNTRTEQHFFCATCGVRTFHKGVSPRWGAYVAVGVNCLDDVLADELASVPVTYLDGRTQSLIT